MARILISAGMRIATHDRHFPDKPATDPEWIKLCADHGFVGLTKDKKTNYSDLAVTTLMTSGAKMFVHIGEHTHRDIAQNIVNSQHVMARIACKYDHAFIARLYMPDERRFQRGTAGNVEMWLTLEQWQEHGRRPKKQR